MRQGTFSDILCFCGVGGVTKSFLNNFSPVVQVDSCSYIWQNGFFSSSKAYKYLSGYRLVLPAFKMCLEVFMSIQTHFFLAASPRQSLAQGTSYRRKNMSFPPYHRYVLYNSQCDETVKHLFLGCPFSDYWNWLLSLQVSLDYTPFVVLERLKVQLSIPFFPEIILLCWSIVWSVRNNFFWGEAFFLSCYKFIFKSVFPLVILRGKSTISLWLLQG